MRDGGTPLDRSSNQNLNQAERPTLQLMNNGWILEWNNRAAFIFDDILGLQANDVIAEKLGVSKVEAWKIRNSALSSWPQNLDDVRRLFPQIVGEDDNVKLAILALFSLKLRNPEERVMGIIIKAANSAGKSYFAKTILKPLRSVKDDFVLEFTRMTGAYLERKFKDADLDRRILFVQETSEAPTQLHLSLSEGKLRVGLVERSNGEFHPIEIEAEGQPFLLATTTNWRGSPDLIHRCILMELDESKEQTYRILEFQAKLNADFIFKERFERFVEGCVKVFKQLWRDAPEDVDVIIPYLPLIEERLKVENPDTKLRRDFNKLIALIKANAILFHRHRKIIKLNDRMVIVADLKDFKEVLSLFKTSLKQTLINLSEKEQTILNALKESSNSSNYSDLAKATKIPSSTLRHYLIPNLEAKGFVVVDKDVRPHRIELVREAEEVSMAIDEARAEEMIEEAVKRLLSSGGQLAKVEKSSETALISEKEAGELAVPQMAKSPGISLDEIGGEGISGEEKPLELAIPKTAKDLGIFSEKERGEGLDHDWPFGRGDSRELKQIFDGPGRLYLVDPRFGEYRGDVELGPLGLGIMLRRKLKTWGGESGILLAAEELKKWPLPQSLRADNLEDQAKIIKRLADHYRGLKASEKAIAVC